MEPRLTSADARHVRALIGRAVLGERAPQPALGSIELRPHQAEAVDRLRAALAVHGGALLADATGLGKTYVALALARDATRPLVVAPAGLRVMWSDALGATETAGAFVTLESLARGRVPDTRPDFVIVDEAHRARNRGTRTHEALGRLCRGVPVLLLTATPIHNRTDDLASLLELFLGARARSLSTAELARCVVRRTDPADRLPRVLPPVPLDCAAADAPLDALLALPPPVPPADAGDAGALVRLGLVRLWASSEAALRAGLRRRLVQGTALRAALEAGRRLTRRELRCWVVGDDAVQLEMPGLFERNTTEELTVPLLDEHLAGLRRVLHALEAHGGADGRRAAALVALRRRHEGERIVAFTQFAETARALFRALRGAPRVAALSAAGGVVAGGRLSRIDVLHRFAPRAHGCAEPRAAERIDLLIATDLLSEGVNLQDASVLVHLDLPWTPARLEQRVGRLARLGSSHERVAVYAMRPPAAAGELLAMERRLHRKVLAAAHLAGVADDIVPPPTDRHEHAPRRAGVTAADEEIRATLRRWSPATAPRSGPGETWLAVCSAERPAWLALLDDRRLLASLDGGAPSDDPRLVAEVVRLADGAPCRSSGRAPVEAPLGDVLSAIARRLEREAAARDVDASVAAADERRAVLRRLEHIAARAPLARRAAIAPLLARARSVTAAPGGVGDERVLGALAAAPLSDDDWLAALLALERRDGSPGAERSGHAVPRALLLLIPPPTHADDPAGHSTRDTRSR